MSITEKNGLKINTKLFDFVNNEVIPDTNIKSEEFWNNFGNIVHELTPINKKLIEKREDIQKKIDDWHKKNKSRKLNKKEHSIRNKEKLSQIAVIRGEGFLICFAY